MIRIENLWKTYRIDGVTKTVCRGITVTFPSRTAVAILGRNGAGKSTLMRIIAGRQAYDSGRIVRHGSFSWPVGFGGSFHPELTGAQNVRFVARIQGVDSDELITYVEDFAELGRHFHLPVRTYSSGMRGRLAFGVSMGIKFDTYIADEATATGDAIFRDKAAAVFRERIKDSGLIMVTHSLAMAEDVCQHGAVLEDGNLTYFTDVKDAIALHLENTRRHRSAAGRGDTPQMLRRLMDDE
jgi:capsular polysaccharide transport system ATP-binding protein